MKTIEIATASPDMVKLLDSASTDDVVVRLADGREFLVVAVEDFDRELTAQRANEKLNSFLDARAKSSHTVSIEDLKRRLNL